MINSMEALRHLKEESEKIQEHLKGVEFAEEKEFYEGQIVGIDKAMRAIEELAN